MSNEELIKQFTEEGYIKDPEISDKFEELIQEYFVFYDQEVEITDLDFEKEINNEEEFWSGNPDDITPSYRKSPETIRMDSYSSYITPTDLDICLYFNKQPQDITKEDCENVDPEDFNDYLKESYRDILFEQAEEEFYSDDYSD